MIITNLTKGTWGLDGIIQLPPGSPVELPETSDYVERAQRLQRAGVVHVTFDKLPPEQKEDQKPSTVENVLAQAMDVLAPKIEASEPVTDALPEVVEKPSRKKSNANVGGNTQ